MPQTRSILSIQLPTGGSAQVVRRRYGNDSGPRVAIVAGIRGDTPEGIRIAYNLAATLDRLESHLQGVVDLYPCVNPLAAEQGLRLWPFFNVDLNRMFPGKKNGHPPELVAHALVSDIRSADYVWELRGARPGFVECTQALVSTDTASALAKHANVKVVWKRTPGRSAPSTFAYQFKNTIVLEGGTGNRLTASVGAELHDGLLNLLARVGILPEEQLPFSWVGIERPTIVDDFSVHRVRTHRSGLFLPHATCEKNLHKGDPIGEVIDPGSGLHKETIVMPCNGVVMALRDHPVISPGEMVARVLQQSEG